MLRCQPKPSGVRQNNVVLPIQAVQLIIWQTEQTSSQPFTNLTPVKYLRSTVAILIGMTLLVLSQQTQGGAINESKTFRRRHAIRSKKNPQ